MFYLSSLSAHFLFAGLEHLYFVSSLTSHFLSKTDLCLWGLMKQLEKFAAMAALEQRDLFKFSTFKFSFGIEPHSN